MEPSLSKENEATLVGGGPITQTYKSNTWPVWSHIGMVPCRDWVMLRFSYTQLSSGWLLCILSSVHPLTRARLRSAFAYPAPKIDHSCTGPHARSRLRRVDDFHGLDLACPKLTAHVAVDDCDWWHDARSLRSGAWNSGISIWVLLHLVYRC